MGTYRMYHLRHSFRLFVLLLTVCLGVSGRLFGQYYPIHATVQWPAPQSPYLVDYSTGSRDRLIVTLLNRDLQQPLLYAKLRLQIKSGSFTARSREEVSYPQLELQTSVPLRLTGIDLSPYLQPQHLQMTGRLEQGRLPSGYAELQLQVIDYYTGRPLSDWHTARAYLDVKKPPFLNLPERDAEVALRDPFFLRFQWTPRHQGLSGTEYEFVLKELPDNGAAPQSAFAYGQEIFRTHTRSTSLSYTHLDPPLLPNRRYAWQVRALVRSGVEEVGMFEHGGLSEVSWFCLNDQCDAPRGLRAQTRYAKVDLSWGKVVGTTGYVVECRPKTKLNVYEWARTESVEERLTLAQLKPGWTYEWRVGTRCTSDRPVFSDVREFTLSKQNEALLADCGKEPVRTDLRGDPHLGIRAGDVVTIGGDYPMTITEVTALGDGWYSGKGKTRLKTIIDAPIALRFDRLRINLDKYQIDGSVEASYDEKRGAIANIDYMDDGGRDLRPATLRLREKQLSFTLPERPQFHLDSKTGTLTVQDAAGNAQRIDLQLPEGEEYKSVFPLLVTDKEGNSYRIQPAVASAEDDHNTSSTHGKVALQSERVERMGDFNSEALSKRYGQIRFSGQGGKYAFDSGSESWYQKSVKLDRFYKPFAKDYIAPWKLIPEGAQDVVTAEYTGNKAIDPQGVRFASEPKSTALPASYDTSSKRWSVSLPSVSSGESYEVFAVYEGEVLGKLRVASYAQQRHKLTLVPINDTKLDKAQIERELNGIYGSVGIHFDVEVDERMRGDYSWDRDGDRKLSIVGRSFFGRVREVKESAEMDYLKKAYSQLSGTLDGLYLFVIDAAQGLEDKPQSLLGEMPRRSRFGYIFSGNSPNGGTSDLGYTIAHELGHGLFTLQHTFDDEYGGRKSQGQTDNLMDYATGKELAAFQWNVLANPAVFTAADKAEEEKLKHKKSLIACIPPELSTLIIESGKTLTAPDGSAFRLPAGAVIRGIFYDDSSIHPAVHGSIASFSIGGRHYQTTERGGKFAGYRFLSRQDTILYPIQTASGDRLSIKVDASVRTITLGGDIYKLSEADFGCGSELPPRVLDRRLFSIDQASLRHIDFARKSLAQNTTPLSEQEPVVRALTDEVSRFGREKNFLGEVLEDKLVTYAQRNASHFVVVQTEVGTVSLDQKEWNKLALKVFERAGLGDRDILITVPYIGLQSLGRSGRVLHMIGVATGANVSVNVHGLRTDHNPAQQEALGRSVRDFVLDLFTHTAKKTTTYRGYFNASRAISIVADNHKGEAVSGYPYNVSVIPYLQKGVDTLATIIQQYNEREGIRTTGQREGIIPEGFSSSENERWLEEYYASALLTYSKKADDLTQYELHEVRMPIHYREQYLEADNGKGIKNYQAYLLQYAYENVLERLNASVRSGFTFRAEHSFTDKTDWFLARYIDQPVYNTLDLASVVLGFMGLDTAPDILNVFYSSLRGDHTNASLNAASLLLVGPTSIKTLKLPLGEDAKLFKLARGNASIPHIEAVSEKRLKQLQRRSHEVYRSVSSHPRFKALKESAQEKLLQQLDVADEALRHELAANPELIDELLDLKDTKERRLWIKQILEGIAFNKERAPFYLYNEVYLESPKAGKRVAGKSSTKYQYVRLDSYNPRKGEIVSRKYTQLSEISEETAIRYLKELKDKYSPGAVIADVASNRVGANTGIFEENGGNILKGQMILEVPVQKEPVPESILKYAQDKNIQIRDINGKVYK